MEDHSGGDSDGGFLPVAFLRAVLASPNDHLCDILRIRNVAVSEKADFRQRIEPRGVGFDGRELEAQVSGLVAEAGCFSPVLAFDVIDNGAFGPRQQRGNDEPGSFATAGWGERKNVLGTVVFQVMQVL